MFEGQTATNFTKVQMDPDLSRALEEIKQGLAENTRLTKETKSFCETQYTELNSKLSTALQENKTLRADLDDANKDRARLREEVNDLKKQGKVKEKERREKEKEDEKKERALNLIIKGIAESDNELMYKTMKDLFAVLSVSFSYANTNGAQRIGKQENSWPALGQTAKQRVCPIRLKCATVQQKSEIHGLKSNLKGHPVYGKVQIINDLDSEELMLLRELQQIVTAARKINGVSAQVKGNYALIGGSRYSRRNYVSLPHNLTTTNVSTLEIGDTVYFQGHLSPLSNLHECSFADEDGQSYNCVEQFYFSRMASVSGETLKKEEILAEKNP